MTELPEVGDQKRWERTCVPWCNKVQPHTRGVVAHLSSVQLSEGISTGWAVFGSMSGMYMAVCTALCVRYTAVLPRANAAFFCVGVCAADALYMHM